MSYQAPYNIDGHSMELVDGLDCFIACDKLNQLQILYMGVKGRAG
jgi:hypothetical protein